MSNDSSLAYLKLKSAEAQKLGRNGGSITYLTLCDIDRRRLFLSIVGNTGGGYWSREIVSLEAVERCLPQDRSQPISAKSLAPSFTGRSSNNPTFLAAVLRSEKLLGPAEEDPHQHRILGDWQTWKAAMLSLDGEPYAPPVKVAKVGGKPGAGNPTASSSPEEATQEPAAVHEVTGKDSPRRKGRKERSRQTAQEDDDAHPA